MAQTSITKETLAKFMNDKLALDRAVTVDEAVKGHIAVALIFNDLRMNQTARELDIDRKTLWRKVREIQVETSGCSAG
jgi:transcriptional regulator of acetoin/glycerol metabolism